MDFVGASEHFGKLLQGAWTPEFPCTPREGADGPGRMGISSVPEASFIGSNSGPSVSCRNHLPLPGVSSQRTTPEPLGRLSLRRWKSFPEWGGGGSGPAQRSYWTPPPSGSRRPAGVGSGRNPRVRPALYAENKFLAKTCKKETVWLWVWGFSEEIGLVFLRGRGGGRSTCHAPLQIEHASCPHTLRRTNFQQNS